MTITKSEASPMQDEIEQFAAWCANNGFDLDRSGPNSILYYVSQCLSNYADLMTAHEAQKTKYQGLVAERDAQIAALEAALAQKE